MPNFIVAEISKNWHRKERIGWEPDIDGPLICHLFEKVIAVNLDRGYRLHSFSLSQHQDGPDTMIETIIAVFETCQVS